MTKVIKVNQQNQVLGNLAKGQAHSGQGTWHRAFSVLVVNNKKQILLQQRSQQKLLWPGFWSNTCCSHPKPGEDLRQAAQKRLEEEMGFTVPLKKINQFNYQAKYKDVGWEKEVLTVLLGRFNSQQINPDPKEVADWQWMDINKLKVDIKTHPDRYTPWFKKIIKLTKELN